VDPAPERSYTCRALADLEELTPEQEEVRRHLEQEVGERWPGLTYHVSAARKIIWRGELRPAEPDRTFGLWYENGPTETAMRDLVAGRTGIVDRAITVGAVLWLSDRQEFRSRLSMEVRRAFADIDLTGEATRALVSANDDWAAQHGGVRNASSAEGWEVLMGAERIASRTRSWWLSHPRGQSGQAVPPHTDHSPAP
jgi:hypothetical protein